MRTHQALQIFQVFSHSESALALDSSSDMLDQCPLGILGSKYEQLLRKPLEGKVGQAEAKREDQSETNGARFVEIGRRGQRRGIRAVTGSVLGRVVS